MKQFRLLYKFSIGLTIKLKSFILKKTAIISLTILLHIASTNTFLGQSPAKGIRYTQNSFERNKISEETYQLRWHKNIWVPDAKDTLAYFVDDRNYKGIVNYGVTFKNRDYTNFHFYESTSMCFLKVEINKCTYSPKDSIISIEGFVTGRMNDQLQNGKVQNQINLFLGEKKDTINTYYFGNACYRSITDRKITEARLNGSEIDESTPLDRFPAFYLKNYSHSTTAPRGPHYFKISGKANGNTLFAIGSRAHYAEIFDVGSMIYHPEKNSRNSQAKKQEWPDCRVLMVKNRPVSDAGKEDLQKEQAAYYSFTEMAENHILAKQYRKAIEQYQQLQQNHKHLFARDIHNAIRSAILTRDFKNAFWWAEKLAYKNVALPYFNSKIFAGLKRNPRWTSFSARYDSICKLTKEKLYLRLKEELNTLVREDQADYGLKNRKDPKKLDETTEKITDRLIELLKKDGYPSEEKIGCSVIRDTILATHPDFYVLITHALQQKTGSLANLNMLLDQSASALEFDRKRSLIGVDPANSCLHIYKGNLYNSKSCVKGGGLSARKIIFSFNNPYSFVMDCGNFILSEYDAKNPKQWDDYYEKNYDFIAKLTENWKQLEN
ncbi:MAG: hypothetical protein REI96_12240 [Flavobacterium nitrogenifigens]|uniref:hypothetical protein n=1 Tax=Flavobacterium nitrogenifigens TaxID=1617283 RepID=UPI002809CE91|nr:hypothetical protein [Flavobacterium nitrogenifigens]MDQ8013213.1 hypothetical protein [Flavobacterium nitrogenifigens]